MLYLLFALNCSNLKNPHKNASSNFPYFELKISLKVLILIIYIYIYIYIYFTKSDYTSTNPNVTINFRMTYKLCTSGCNAALWTTLFSILCYVALWLRPTKMSYISKLDLVYANYKRTFMCDHNWQATGSNKPTRLQNTKKLFSQSLIVKTSRINFCLL